MKINKYDDVDVNRFIKDYKANQVDPSQVQMPFNTKIDGRRFYVGITYVGPKQPKATKYPENGFYLFIEPGSIHKNDNLIVNDDNNHIRYFLIKPVTKYSEHENKKAHQLWVKPFFKGIAIILTNDYNNNSIHMTNYVNNMKKNNEHIKDTLASVGNVSKMNLWNKSKVAKFMQNYDVTNA